MASIHTDNNIAGTLGLMLGPGLATQELLRFQIQFLTATRRSQQQGYQHVGLINF